MGRTKEKCFHKEISPFPFLISTFYSYLNVMIRKSLINMDFSFVAFKLFNFLELSKKKQVNYEALTQFILIFI